MAHRMAILIGAASAGATAALVAGGLLDVRAPTPPYPSIARDLLADAVASPAPVAETLGLEAALAPVIALAEAATAPPAELRAWFAAPAAPGVFEIRPAFVDAAPSMRFASLAPERPTWVPDAALPPPRPGFAEAGAAPSGILAVRPPARPDLSRFQVVSIDPALPNAAPAVGEPPPAADAAARGGVFGGWSLPALPSILGGEASRGPEGRSLQSGIASWYGPGFHGRRTASGEVFNQHALTAAHRSLPFGTKVRVVDEITGRSIVVRINDRGPFKHNRIIDLSKGSAQALGLGGLGRVKLVAADE